MALREIDCEKGGDFSSQNPGNGGQNGETGHSVNPNDRKRAITN